MVCKKCRKGHHKECPGKTWCDCAHVEVAEEQNGGASG